jgi:hypothetical protein
MVSYGADIGESWEEAAEIPEHHVVSCLTPSCQQLIMIGDHQQLRPAYNDYETAKQYKILTGQQFSGHRWFISSSIGRIILRNNRI